MRCMTPWLNLWTNRLLYSQKITSNESISYLVEMEHHQLRKCLITPVLDMLLSSRVAFVAPLWSHSYDHIPHAGATVGTAFSTLRSRCLNSVARAFARSWLLMACDNQRTMGFFVHCHMQWIELDIDIDLWRNLWSTNPYERTCDGWWCEMRTREVVRTAHHNQDLIP